MLSSHAFTCVYSMRAILKSVLCAGRVPAGLNGCVGIKPTRGMITTTGVVPAAASLDCVTVLARSVPDAALVVKIMQVWLLCTGFVRHLYELLICLFV